MQISKANSIISIHHTLCNMHKQILTFMYKISSALLAAYNSVRQACNQRLYLALAPSLTVELTNGVSTYTPGGE